MKTLSKEQKNQITSELDNIKRSRELFRGTLSKKQLDISDVSNSVDFLISSKSGMVTNQVIYLGGI